MAKDRDKDKGDQILDAYLRGGSTVSRLYGAGALAGPPAALDHVVLSAARKAVQGAGGMNPFGGRWYVPLSAAAMIALAVGLTLFMQREGVPPVTTVATELEDRIAADGARPSAPMADESYLRHQRERDMLAKKAKPPMAEEKLASGSVASTPPRSEERMAETATPPTPAPAMFAAGAAREAKKEGGVKTSAADVTAVRASGSAGAYQFSVTVRSPDTGCAQFADWWEVLGEDGRLLYRRVLLHSHVDEQPFTRSGGPVPVDAGTVVIVRAHMNTRGYGGTALKGSVARGFAPVTLPPGFAAEAAAKPPLPDGCAF